MPRDRPQLRAMSGGPTRDELEAWKDALDMMFSATVIPRRSVDRIRRAITEGRNPEPFLKDIEDGMAQCGAIYEEMDARPPGCPACSGTGANPRASDEMLERAARELCLIPDEWADAMERGDTDQDYARKTVHRLLAAALKENQGND